MSATVRPNNHSGKPKCSSLLSFDVTGQVMVELLEQGYLTWVIYSDLVAPEHRPREYKDLPAYLRNKERAPERRKKLAAWDAHGSRRRR